jgi:LysM repeat protein
MRSLQIIQLLIAVMLLAACTPAVVEDTLTPTPEGTLRPYQVTLAVITPTATASPTLTQTNTPLPTQTPTPFAYKVRKDDDMGGIAYRFGISVSALKTANPSVNPCAMGEGLILAIPATPVPKGMPSPTLIYSSPPVCYPSQDSGLWCYLLVKNEQAAGLENLTGKVILTTGGAEGVVEQMAVSLMNILPAGKAFPLAAFFPDRPAGSYSVEGQVTGMLPQPSDDPRYLAVSLADQRITLAPDLKSARLTGNVKLAQSGVTARQVWVAAVAYTSDGAVAGLRKWEASTSLIEAGSLPFDFTVYSLSPDIDHVELFVEARPWM